MQAEVSLIVIIGSWFTMRSANAALVFVMVMSSRKCASMPSVLNVTAK